MLATQNPVEMQGTYPLPEAQLDRFLLKLHFEYPTVDGAERHGARTTPTGRRLRPRRRRRHAAAHECAGPLAPRRARRCSTTRAAWSIATAPLEGAVRDVRSYVRLGPSPRGAQALTLAGSVAALIAGRQHLAYEDIRAVALPALRHRLVLTFDAERNGVTADEIVSAVVRGVREDAP